jgi:hypothetical protein
MGKLRRDNRFQMFQWFQSFQPPPASSRKFERRNKAEIKVFPSGDVEASAR